ncbi:MAG TPA: hypothetical protein VNK23_16720 [Candidatus Dormibacteraeota bacterium]|nr:hypothetical protein [Candidatus Dormibacteraeota bacterium]
MRHVVDSLFLILVAALLAAQPAAAYEHPLTSDAIRDAYFIGKTSASKREAFLSSYTRHFPRPDDGPYISLIRVITPFAYVVERTARSLPAIHAPDAVQEFYGKPIPVRFRVRIDLTPTYGWQVRSHDGGVRLRNPNFWRKFSVQVIQGKDTLQPVGERGEPDYSFATDGSSSVLMGADIEMEYDPADVRSAPVTVVVQAPDGQQMEATFNLANLR